MAPHPFATDVEPATSSTSRATPSTSSMRDPMSPLNSPCREVSRLVGRVFIYLVCDLSAPLPMIRLA